MSGLATLELTMAEVGAATVPLKVLEAIAPEVWEDVLEAMDPEQRNNIASFLVKMVNASLRAWPDHPDCMEVDRLEVGLLGADIERWRAELKEDGGR